MNKMALFKDFTRNSITFLRFTLDPDAPQEYVFRWQKFRNVLLNIETTFNMKDSQDDILNKWKSYCNLDSNQNLPTLIRLEGGLGGNDNRTNKQIRPSQDALKFPNLQYYHGIKDEIRIILLDAEDEKFLLKEGSIIRSVECWTIDEMYDLMQAFIQTCNYYTLSRAVRGQIIIEPCYDDTF